MGSRKTQFPLLFFILNENGKWKMIKLKIHLEGGIGVQANLMMNDAKLKATYAN